MTKLKATLLALKIVKECDKHSEENGSCMECPFGIKGTCLVSGGNDIPHIWQIKEKISELIE